MHSFPFFFGTNGSGTTLHRAIFDSHPDLAIPGESRFIVRLARNRQAYERPGGMGALVADLRMDPRLASWGLSLDDYEAELLERGSADFPDAIRLLYRQYADRQGKPFYGDKTQAYIHDLPLLAELFPEARFIHAVRDGRDVSLAHTDGTKVELVALSWKRRVRTGREAGAALGPGRYVESYFEDLIEDPERAVKRLCAFLDLDFDPQMLKYYERADEIIAGTAKPDRHLDIHLPPTKGLRDWRQELSTDQVMRFEALAGDLLEELGYERAFDRVSLSARIGAWWQLSAQTGRHLARRIRKLLRR